MANRLFIPFLNSIKFVLENPAAFPQYAKKSFDYGLFSEQQFPWQEKKVYAQKRSIYDSDFFQLESNYDPIQIELTRSDDNVAVLVVSAQNIRRNQYATDYYIYEVDINYADVDPGCYYMRMRAGGDTPTIWISEPIEIIPDIENTVLLEYSNNTFYGDVVWETAIAMSLRVEGVLSSYLPGSKDVIYEDQVLNNTMLSSLPYRTFKLFIGGSEGIPEYLIDKINWIVGCDNFRVDGKYFVKAEGAKWERKEEQDYPMQGWTIDLREALNRASSVFDSENPSNKKLLVIHNVESKGFGDLSDNAGSNIIAIQDIE